MIFEDLVKGLGSRLGTDFAVEDGVCTLGVDDMVVTIMELPEVESVALSGDIGEPPPQGLTQLYRAMLAANHLFSGTGGATISYDETKNVFVLCRLDSSADIDVDGFFSVLERFVNTLETWRKLLADYRPPESEEPQRQELQDEFGAQRLGSSFMSV